MKHASAVLLLALLPVSGCCAFRGQRAGFWADPARVSSKLYRVVAEDARVRVIELVLPPGTRDDWHSHPAGAWTVVESGHVQIEDARGRRNVKLERGRAGIQRRTERHRITNIGATTLRVTMVELKERREE